MPDVGPRPACYTTPESAREPDVRRRRRTYRPPPRLPNRCRTPRDRPPPRPASMGEVEDEEPGRPAPGVEPLETARIEEQLLQAACVEPEIERPPVPAAVQAPLDAVAAANEEDARVPWIDRHG